MEKGDFGKGAESYNLKPRSVKWAQDVSISIMSDVKLNHNMDVLIVQANGLI
jgi:hypothetical protein